MRSSGRPGVWTSTPLHDFVLLIACICNNRIPLDIALIMLSITRIPPPS